MNITGSDSQSDVHIIVAHSLTWPRLYHPPFSPLPFLPHLQLVLPEHHLDLNLRQRLIDALQALGVLVLQRLEQLVVPVLAPHLEGTAPVKSLSCYLLDSPGGTKGVACTPDIPNTQTSPTCIPPKLTCCESLG